MLVIQRTTNWTDKVGGNNGTLVNGTHHNDGPFVGAGYVEFDGNTDKLSCTPSNLTGEFTIEGWWYANAFPATTVLFGNWGTGCLLRLANAGSELQWYTTGLLSGMRGSIGFTLSTGTWYHVAVSRDSSNVHRTFVNGTQIASETNSVSITMTNFCIGAENTSSTTTDIWNGYISNFRILNGTALYTSNFTPPTKPLTAVTNTSLLTCQGNTIADASSSAHTITANGDISLTKEPFGGAGAVDFGGSADGLYTPNITLGSNDWTLEFWIYLTSTGTARGLYSYFLGNTPDRQISYFIDSSNQFGWQHRLNDGTYPSAAGSTALSAHTWYHVAAVRVNDDYYTYINGVQDSSYTSAPAGHTYYADGVPHYIGYNRTGASDFDGLLSNVRFVNGTALYTSNFTPPAEPLTVVTNTELLTCQGQNIKDYSSSAHAITVNGDAKATIVSSSFEFDGTGDYVQMDSSTDTDLSGDFTIEAWVYPTANGESSNSEIVSRGAASTLNGWHFAVANGTTRLFFGVNYAGTTAAVYTLTSGSMTLNSWNHVAVTRSGDTVRIFIDGSLDVTNSSATGRPTVSGTEYVYVGRGSYDLGNREFNGKISAVKIYKGKGLTAAEVEQNYNATKGRYV
jgi:hypothetical protein